MDEKSKFVSVSEDSIAYRASEEYKMLEEEERGCHDRTES